MTHYTYQYPHPAVCVDIILLVKNTVTNSILLIERKHPPFENSWALPGGFIDMHETLEQSALRELEEETGIKLNSLKQFASYGDPGRDPRERTVSVVYYKILNEEKEAIAGDDAAKAKWFPLNNLPTLAFDHNKIIKDFIDSAD